MPKNISDIVIGSGYRKQVSTALGRLKGILASAEKSGRQPAYTPPAMPDTKQTTVLGGQYTKKVEEAIRTKDFETAEAALPLVDGLDPRKARVLKSELGGSAVAHYVTQATALARSGKFGEAYSAMSEARRFGLQYGVPLPKDFPSIEARIHQEASRRDTKEVQKRLRMELEKELGSSATT